MKVWFLPSFVYISIRYSTRYTEAVLDIRLGRRWPTQTRSWPTQTARVIPMIPTYTTPVVLPKICLAFDWPTQMKIPRTAPDNIPETDAYFKITKLYIKMLQDESWNETHLFYSQGHKLEKHCLRGSLHTCECWFLVVQSIVVVIWTLN